MLTPPRFADSRRLGHNFSVELGKESAEISLRPVAEGDADFLYGLYAETRRDEVALFGWDAASADAFLRMQFDVRTRSYAMQYPQAEDNVIVLDGRIAGRMIVDRTETAIVLVDIAVAGAFRQKGIASCLIKQLQSESAAAGVPLELRVDRSNTNALSLYQKLGLEIKDEDQIQFLMTWEGHRR